MTRRCLGHGRTVAVAHTLRALVPAASLGPANRRSGSRHVDAVRCSRCNGAERRPAPTALPTLTGGRRVVG